MSREIFLLANLAVFAGFLVRGITGFGAVLVTLPALALWLPAKTAVPLIAVLSIANGFWLTWRARRQIDHREMVRLLAGGMPATITGVLLFQYAPGALLQRILGLTVAALGLWLATRSEGAPMRTWPESAGLPAGITSGVLGGLFGFSGPSAVLYLTGRPLDPSAFRATMLVFLTAIDVVRSASMAASGALTLPLYLVGLSLCPASLLGSWCGERLQRKLSAATFRRMVGVLLALLGAALALR